MAFSEEYLDKMLNFAVKYHSNNLTKLVKIPENLDSLVNAKEIFTKSLEFETATSLKQETNKIENPLLYSVNLDSTEPGIVIGNKNNDDLIVYTKINKYDSQDIEPKKKQKPKSKEQIEEKAIKDMEKLKNKYKEEEYEMDIKNKKQNVKEMNKDIKNKTKEIEKIDKRTQKIYDQISNLESNIEKYPKKKKEFTEKINNNMNNIDNMNTLKNSYLNQNDELKQKIENFMTTINNYDDIKNKKKEENAMKKLLKQKEKEKLQELKNIPNINDDSLDNYDLSDDTDLNQDKDLNNTDSTNDNKKKKPKKNVPDKNYITENEHDILEEFYNISTDKYTETEKKEITQDNAKFFPSPVPLERHLNAIQYCDPNPVLLPTLLYGTVIDEEHNFIKVFHGPPGTGKTYTIIKELENLLKKTYKSRILVCAPSNIGVLNLYNRAKKFNINGVLILSNTANVNKEDIPDDDNIKKSKINKKIVFTTISMRFGKILKDIDFNTIFVDEAAQCQESLIWGLLKKSVTRLYLSGDPMQLPALVSEEGKKYNHGRSMIERLMNLNYPTILLDTQRRMHPKIAEFPNQYFYENKLKTEYNFSYDIPPIEVYHVQGHEELDGTSFYNMNEVDKIIKIYNDLSNNFNDIIIISPYNAQCSKLRNKDKNLNVHTIDSFQGKEADIIILTTVRSKDDVGFWNDPRRLNVGLTRARHGLRIVGNIETWNKKNGPLKDYLNYINLNNFLIK